MSIREPSWMNDEEEHRSYMRGNKRKDLYNPDDDHGDSWDAPTGYGRQMDKYGTDISAFKIRSDREQGLKRKLIRKQGMTRDGFQYDRVQILMAKSDETLSHAIRSWKDHNHHLLDQSEIVTKYKKHSDYPNQTMIYYRESLSNKHDPRGNIEEAFAHKHPRAYQTLLKHDYPLLESALGWASGQAHSVDEAVSLAVHRIKARTNRSVDDILESWGCETPEQLQQLVEYTERQLNKLRGVNESVAPGKEMGVKHAPAFMVVDNTGRKIVRCPTRSEAQQACDDLNSKNDGKKYTVKHIERYPVGENRRK